MIIKQAGNSRRRRPSPAYNNKGGDGAGGGWTAAGEARALCVVSVISAPSCRVPLTPRVPYLNANELHFAILMRAPYHPTHPHLTFQTPASSRIVYIIVGPLILYGRPRLYSEGLRAHSDRATRARLQSYNEGLCEVVPIPRRDLVISNKVPEY